MADESILESQWYWDRRNRKAYFPLEKNDGAIQFVTIWHIEEVTDALEGGALVPIDEVGLDRTDTTFSLLESFRIPPHLEASTNANRTDQDSGTHE